MKRLLTAFVLVITFCFGAWAQFPSFEQAHGGRYLKVEKYIARETPAQAQQRHLYQMELERQRQNAAQNSQILRHYQEQATAAQLFRAQVAEKKRQEKLEYQAQQEAAFDARAQKARQEDDPLYRAQRAAQQAEAEAQRKAALRDLSR